jgi:hypothetical protein
MPEIFQKEYDYKYQRKMFTGDVTVDFPGDWDDYASVIIVHDQPLPFTLKGIIPRVTVNDD